MLPVMRLIWFRCRRPTAVDADRCWCFVPLFRHSGHVLSIGRGSWSLSAPPDLGIGEARAMASALVDAVGSQALALLMVASWS